MKLRYLLCTLVLSLLPVSAWAFSDLNESHPYYKSLIHLKDKGIIKGYDDNTVRPDAKINRAELLKILIEGLGHNPDSDKNQNCFPDVKEEWFAKYVCFGLEKNWVAGYPDGTFKPDQDVNKVEALKIILNAFEFVPGSPTKSPFSDTPTDAWFAGFVQLAKEKNFLPETGAMFVPAGKRTRGEIAEIISRIIRFKENDEKIDQDKKKDDQSVGGDDDWPEEWVDAENKTLELLNKLREEDGKPPLTLNPHLTKVAREHSKDMAENIGTLNHDSADGRTAHDRIKASGFEFSGATGENIGAGTTGSFRTIYEAIEDVHLDIFMQEPDTGFNHKTTMLSRSFPFSQVGIGVYVKEDKMYFTTDFISIQ